MAAREVAQSPLGDRAEYLIEKTSGRPALVRLEPRPGYSVMLGLIESRFTVRALLKAHRPS